MRYFDTPFKIKKYMYINQNTYIWIDLFHLFSIKLLWHNCCWIAKIYTTYRYVLLSNYRPVTKWTKDYPGSPVEPSMSERDPAEWDGHRVGESHPKTKLTFQRTGTLSVFPLLVGTHEIVFLVHFSRNITYLQWLKKYSPIINLTVHICKENIIYWCFFFILEYCCSENYGRPS